ncbi:MAG: GNAT family N-acetyltransferase [Gammaproteobacteria bacterium]|nr:GNAT family N-acetyltransferase [Gammaproteobacteria bacterium]
MAHLSDKDQSTHPSHPRDYPIFRPYEEECPVSLLGNIPEDEFILDNIRIMRHEQEIIAAYRFSQIDQFCYQIHSLKVLPAYRGQGIGKWLLAHVLGIIESKGGQCAVTSIQRNATFFEYRGFSRTPSGTLQFIIVPE